MTYLLKISPAALSGTTAVVPKMKSTKLSVSDTGKQVFIWLDDYQGRKSGLYATSTLAGMEDVEIPQVRNPGQTKPAYRLQLSNVSTEVTTPLTTDDLEEYRYSEGTGGLEKLGKLHRDRNDKIIALSSSEADELAARFAR